MGSPEATTKLTNKLSKCSSIEIQAWRQSSTTIKEFPRLTKEPSYIDFFAEYLLPNKPCILPASCTSQWRSRKEWVKKDGTPNLELLEELFGHCTVPVADCSMEQYSSHCKQDMLMKDFITYWREYKQMDCPPDMRCLYLKDWHFVKMFPEYTAYETPAIFRSDWLNEFWVERTDSEDDYRFVYMGPKGTWTSFHADVFRSYSWSANICGRKKWLFLPPGAEESLKDSSGNLPFDISNQLSSSDTLPVISVIQEAGEVIFVPSGWFHQVWNLEDTISINHNWLNGCNIDIAWKFLQRSLQDVKHEIRDCQDMDEWPQQCQLILKSCNGIDYAEFLKFIEHIADNRLKHLQNIKCCCDGELCEKCNESTSDCARTGESYKNHCLFDLRRIRDVLLLMQADPDFSGAGLSKLLDDIKKWCDI